MLFEFIRIWNFRVRKFFLVLVLEVVTKLILLIVLDSAWLLWHMDEKISHKLRNFFGMLNNGYIEEKCNYGP